jgi:hypothetical protein
MPLFSSISLSPLWLIFTFHFSQNQTSNIYIFTFLIYFCCLLYMVGYDGENTKENCSREIKILPSLAL